jgi:hypothetical protein
MKVNRPVPAPRGGQSSAFAPQGIRNRRCWLRRRPKSETMAGVGIGIRRMPAYPAFPDEVVILSAHPAHRHIGRFRTYPRPMFADR